MSLNILIPPPQAPTSQRSHLAPQLHSAPWLQKYFEWLWKYEWVKLLSIYVFHHPERSPWVKYLNWINVSNAVAIENCMCVFWSFSVWSKFKKSLDVFLSTHLSLQYNAMRLCQQWTTLSSHQTLHQHHLFHLWNAPTALLCTQVMALKFR